MRDVSTLAAEFSMTKATVSDSVNVLIKKGLISRHRSVEDGRRFLLNVTPAGKEIAVDVSSFANAFKTPFGSWTEKEKEAFYDQLLSMLSVFSSKGPYS